MEVGKTIRRLRRERDLSQEYVANLVGVTNAHISRLEAGKVDPNTDMLERIAKALGVSVTTLIGGESAPIVSAPTPEPTNQLPVELRSLDSKKLHAVLTIAIALAELKDSDFEAMTTLGNRLKVLSQLAGHVETKRDPLKHLR
jgi:transcriptional regulator with XRE-family HTH domain